MDLSALSSFDTSLDGAFGPLDAGVDGNWPDFGSGTFTAINQHSVTPSTSGQTVSPKDIFRDPGASAPASTAFTNLTSPDMESPYMMEGSFDTSPIFNTDADLAGPTDQWYSLFPDSQEKPAGAEALDRTASSQSLAQTNSSGNSPGVLIESRRKSSVIDKSPSQSHSAVAGVKPRRRKGPLPPITVNDPSDKAAIKRARNTMAARDSRQRKVDHVNTLERKIRDLEAKMDRYRDLYGELPIDTPAAESQ
jgi:general control protein GCN4